MEARAKLGLSVAGFSVAVAALLSHSNSSLYPYLYAGGSIAGLSLVAASINASRNASLTLVTGAIGLGVFLRTYTFLYPASLIGMDPDKKAISIQRVIETGTYETAVKYFYQDVPLFQVFGGMFGLVSDLSGVQSPVIYSIAMGVMLPLAAVILVKNMSNHRLTGAAPLAAVLATVETIGVREGFWIHNQTVGILLLTGVLIALGVRVHLKSRIFSIVGIFLIAITFGHKLPLAVISVIGIGVAGYIFVTRYRLKDAFRWTDTRGLVRVVILSSILLIVQWEYVSGSFNRLVLRPVGILGDSPQIGQASSLNPEVAVETLPPLLDILLWRGHGAVLLAFAGLAWLKWHISACRSKQSAVVNRPTVLVLASSSILAAAIVIGTFNPQFIPSGRFYSYGGPVFGALIANAAYSQRRVIVYHNKETVKKYLLVGALGALIFSQMFCMLIMIDQPDRPRMYLTAGEVDAREFNHKFIEEPVHTDWYYSKEVIPNQILNQGDSIETQLILDNQKPIILGLLEGVLSGTEYKYVSYRTTATVQRTPYGKFQLIWNPELRLNRQMNKIHNSGDTMTYSRV